VTSPFSIAWVRRVRFGVLAAVPLPTGTEPVPSEVLSRLHPREVELATAERGRRQIELVGGRLAYHAARAELGLAEATPLLSSSSRAPLGPAGVTASVSHKEDLALALVASSADGLVGVDLEGGPRDRSAIMSKVCRPEELEAVQQLPETERWPNVMVRFAVKEAIYKAIAPQLGRFFGFQAARVEPEPTGATVTMFLEPADPRYRVEVELERLGTDRVIAMVRASPTARP